MTTICVYLSLSENVAPPLVETEAQREFLGVLLTITATETTMYALSDTRFFFNKTDCDGSVGRLSHI